jgi:TonB family protein
LLRFARNDSFFKRFPMQKIIFSLLISFWATPSVFCQQNRTKPTASVENTPAEFPNGQAAMYKFINDNLKYPKDKHTGGLVVVYFCVETDGSITSIEVKLSKGKTFDDEAVRVVGLMPKWKPALQYGTNKPIKSYYTVPIKFNRE